jgi:hypothetical protein
MFREIYTVLREKVETHLLAALLIRVAEGEAVEIGALSISREGMAGQRGVKWATWSDYHRTLINDGYVHVAVDNGKGGHALIALMQTGEPNAILLPRLLAECAAAFR